MQIEDFQQNYPQFGQIQRFPTEFSCYLGCCKLRFIIIREVLPKMGVEGCGTLAITSPGGEGDPQIIDQSCCPSYEEPKCPLGGRYILHPAQVIQASCSQTLGSDLGSRASVKTVYWPGFFGLHEVRYSNGVEGKGFGVW